MFDNKDYFGGTILDDIKSHRINTLSAVDNMLEEGDIYSALQCAVNKKLNILIIGETGSGKTRLINALLNSAPPGDNIVVLESVNELNINHTNCFRINYENISGDALIEAVSDSLVPRNTRIIFDDIDTTSCTLSDSNALYLFFRSANSYYPGCIASMHAPSSDAAFTMLALKIVKSNPLLNFSECKTHLSAVIDLVVNPIFEGGINFFLPYFSKSYDASSDTAT